MTYLENGNWSAHPAADMTALPTGVAGVFETVLWRSAAPVFWSEHWARFDAGCKWCAIRPPLDPHTLLALATDVADANTITTGVLRYAAWKTAGGVTHWRVEVSPPRPHMSRETLTVTGGPVLPQPGPDRAFKHLGRTAWNDALKCARAAGFDEVLLRDESGFVVEGAVSNVMFTRDGVLHTPPLALGGLPGIMRAQVGSVWRSLGRDFRETPATIEELRGADEVWLTNSLIGVKPVRRLASHTFPSLHPRCAELRAAFRNRFGWDPARPSDGG